MAIRVAGEARDDVRAELAAQSIETGIHYPVPLSEQPALAPYHRACPNSERAARELLSLPIDPFMTFQEVDRVCRAVVELCVA